MKNLLYCRNNNNDCCLCNQSNWNKVYTSKNSDTINNGNDNTPAHLLP